MLKPAITLATDYSNSSLQSKILTLLDQRTILPKIIYDKEGKLAAPTQILPVKVRGPALILKIEIHRHNAFTLACSQ